ncbi:MAG: hypothetical protein EOM26_03960 [Alphaproteobacteria bacterium]|nr:hypothetical protein [Alphaproteobacteria bacterium]
MQGRLDFEDSIFGVLGDGARLLMVTMVPPGLSKPEEKRFKQKHVDIAQNSFIPLGHVPEAALSSVFSEAARGKYFGMDLASGYPVDRMLEIMMDAENPKNVIFCRDRDIFLELCTKLGVSLRDLRMVAGMGRLLEQKTASRNPEKRVISSEAYNLSRKLLASQVPITLDIPGQPGVMYSANREWARQTARNLSSAMKYQFQSLEGRSGTERHHSRYYLPFERCFFECVVPPSIFGGRPETKLLCLATLSDEGQDPENFTLSVTRKVGEQYLQGALLAHIRGGVMQDEPLVDMDMVDNSAAIHLVRMPTIMPEFVSRAAREVLRALEIINAPRGRITPVDDMGIGAARRRQGDDASYFRYHLVDLPEPLVPGLASRSQGGRSRETSGEDASGFRQPWHIRKGHLRTFHTSNGPEIRWVGPYPAGDPSRGISARYERAGGPS